MATIKLYAKSNPKKTTTVDLDTWNKFKNSTYRLWTSQAPAVSTPAPTYTPTHTSTPAPVQTSSTPYYGTFQDLANQGLQIVHNKVYSNGKIIGNYGGIKAPGSPPAPTPKQTSNTPTTINQEQLRKGAVVITLGKDLGGGVYQTGLGQFSRADLINQGFKPVGGTSPSETPTPITTNTIPYYGTFQELANKGLQVVGNKVYSNGQVIGSYGGANKPGGKDETPQTFNKAELEQQIKDTLATQGIGQKTANADFINAVIKYKFGRDASPDELNGQFGVDKFGLKGATVKDIVDKFGLGGLAPAFGQNLDESGTTSGNAIMGGIPTVGGATGEGTSPVLSALDELIASKQSALGEQIDITEFLKAKQDAAMNVEKARQAIADKKFLDATQLDQIRDKPITMASIAGQQARFSRDQQLENLALVQDYNNKLILSKMAEGNFLEAQQINQGIAQDNFEIEKLKIDRAVEQQRITENEATLLRQEEQTNYERAKDGFIWIKSQDQLKGLTENDIIRVNGKIYKKPVEQTGGSSGGGSTNPNVNSGSQGKSQWTQNTANQLYQDYIDSGAYTSEKAAQRVSDLTGFEPEMGDWEYAITIVQANPSASRSELEVALRQHTNLNAGDIKSILDAAGL